MLKRLMAIFLVVPVIELLLLFIIARFLGWGWTIGITVVSSLLGAYLAKISGRQWWETVKRDWASEGFPVHRLGEGALILISMAFMITPGPLTGVIGLLFMIPKVRMAAARILAKWLSSRFLERMWH